MWGETPTETALMQLISQYITHWERVWIKTESSEYIIMCMYIKKMYAFVYIDTIKFFICNTACHWDVMTSANELSKAFVWEDDGCELSGVKPCLFIDTRTCKKACRFFVVVQ